MIILTASQGSGGKSVATTVKPLTRSELAEKYSDPEWQEKLLDLLSLVGVLRECIIRAEYRPSSDLNAAINLSDAGVQVRTRMATQEKVNPKDAQLLTLLGVAHIEPLINVQDIDLNELAGAISDEITSGAIVFPLIFGRDLYEKATTLFREERDYLNHEDTLKLLEGREQGVFQAGHYLIGPFGIHRREYYRRLGPVTAIPIQHCSDNACSAVHRIQLTTSIEAGVNKARPALGKVLDQISDEPSEWNGYISDLTEDRFNKYEVDEHVGVEYLIGDAFSDDELRRLVIHAGDEFRKDFHAIPSELGLKGSAKDFTAPLGRSSLLQILFMLDNTTLVKLLDSAVQEGIMIVPADEVRSPRVNRAVRIGAWSLRPQMSRLGVRSLSSDPDLPLLRLSALARTLFDIESADDMNELAWVLRGTTGDTPDEKLAEFLRTSEPSQIVVKRPRFDAASF